jgi:hypothetical protein
MTHTFRDIFDTSSFYISLIAGLFVVLLTSGFNLLKEHFINPISFSKLIFTLDFIFFIVIACSFIFFSWKWSKIKDIQEEMEIAR